MSIFNKLITACFLICCFTDAFGYDSQNHTMPDSIYVAQLYDVSNKVKPFELTFNTQEQTIQTHDGQDVFCNNRKVEYRIVETASKIVIKRKILHSEKKILTKDKSIQNIYPNVTSIQLCGLLKPGKMKFQEFEHVKVACSFSETGDECEVTLYKTDRLPKREETFFGDTVRYENVTEKLRYESGERSISLDKIKRIVSKIIISDIPKNGIQHKVELVERIVVL